MMSNTDDVRAIEIAKTEYREGYNTGDVARVMGVFGEDFVDLSIGQPRFSGADAHVALEERLRDLFDEYDVKMFVIMAYLQVSGEFASDWGFHKIWLYPKRGGSPCYLKLRYTENWVKLNGEWKISLLMSALDEEPQLHPKKESAVLGQAATPNAPSFPPQVGASAAR
jgi:ketosteroid isomerase-like protein